MVYIIIGVLAMLGAAAVMNIFSGPTGAQRRARSAEDKAYLEMLRREYGYKGGLSNK